MLEITDVKVYDLKESVIASRNSMRVTPAEYTDEEFDDSLNRAIKLAKCKSGSGHDSWLKGVRVSFNIKYPDYISPELQRYNFVDIVSSSSKMHKLMNMDLDVACNKYVTQKQIDNMKEYISTYKSIKNDHDFKLYCSILRDGSRIVTQNKEEALYHAFMKCISNCPHGIELFMRCSTNYLQLKTIYAQRKGHVLKDDWGAFLRMIESLPYSKEFITGGK